jgi:hypothetical protein
MRCNGTNLSSERGVAWRGVAEAEKRCGRQLQLHSGLTAQQGYYRERAGGVYACWVTRSEHDDSFGEESIGWG